MPRSGPDLLTEEPRLGQTIDIGVALIVIGLLLFAADLLQPCTVNCPVVGPVLSPPYVLALGLLSLGNLVAVVALLSPGAAHALSRYRGGAGTLVGVAVILLGFLLLAGWWFVDRTFPGTAGAGISASEATWAFAGFAGLLVAGAGNVVVLLGIAVRR